MPLGLAGLVVALALAPIAVAESKREARPSVLGTGRVVLVPLNLAVKAAPEVEPGLAPVWSELLQSLASVERPVVALEREGAGSLWNEVMAEEAKERGKQRADLYDAYGRFARLVAEQTEFESIVFPTLVTHAARVRGRVADWDGVRRKVEIPGLFAESIDTYREGKIWVNRSGAQGELAAASLHVAVLSPAGELIYQGTGGLVLLQELTAPRDRKDIELTIVMRKEAFADAKEVREGISAAFRTPAKRRE